LHTAGTKGVHVLLGVHRRMTTEVLQTSERESTMIEIIVRHIVLLLIPDLCGYRHGNDSHSECQKVIIENSIVLRFEVRWMAKCST
jgi:hypothetical protein